jgi:hypothetical protein
MAPGSGGNQAQRALQACSVADRRGDRAGDEPINPGPEHYEAEASGGDLGETIEAVRGALAGQPDESWLLGRLQDLVERCWHGRASREHLKARLFAMILGWVPGYMLRPIGFSPWPGQLFEWWLTRRGTPIQGGVVWTADQLVESLSMAGAGSPIRVVSGQLGRERPRRFVLGRARFAPIGRGAAPDPSSSGPGGWVAILSGLVRGER